MANLVQQLVTASVTLIFGNQGSATSPIQLVNTDTANSVWLGTSSTVAADSTSAVELGPLASMSFDGSTTVYGVTSGPKVMVAVVPGGTAYSPGSLTISGPTTVDIAGPVEVEGSVGITGTPDVGISGTVTVDVPNAVTVSSITNPVTTNATITNTVNTAVTNTVATNVSNNVSVQNAAGGSLTVAGSVNVANTPSVTVSGTPAVTVSSGTVAIGNTPSVTLSGTPNVAISSGTVNATLTGTTDVSVQNATLDVVGSGGYVLPGQITQLALKTNLAIAANTDTAINLGNVQAYQSLDFMITSNAGVTTTGAAYCVEVVVEFFDPTNTYVMGAYNFGIPLGGLASFSIPCVGPSAQVFLYNSGSAGSMTLTDVVIWGSYRNITDFTWTSYSVPLPASDSTITWIPPNYPAGSLNKWLSCGTYTPAVAGTTYGILLPPVVGLVTGNYFVGNSGLANDPVVIDMSLQVRGNIVAGSGNSAILLNVGNGAATAATFFQQYYPITFPAIILKAGTVGASFQFIATHA